MRAIAYILGMSAIACVLQACAGKTNPPVPIQPVIIKGDTLCRVQQEPLTWHPADTRASIDGVRRFNAKWYSRCGRTQKPVG